MADNSEEVIVRRAIPALHLWPGDKVRKRTDGRYELVRPLPINAELVLQRAATRGDTGDAA